MIFNKRITYVFIVLLFLVGSSNSFAKAKMHESKVPDDLSPGLNHLADVMAEKSGSCLSLGVIEDVLDFVVSPKKDSNLYYAEEKFDSPSAYYQFYINKSFDRVLEYLFNPGIPAYAFALSSVRVSSWKDVEGPGEPLRRPCEILGADGSPVVVNGIEHVENTPDLHTGASHSYTLDRTMIHTKHKGRKVLISLSKQRGVSEVGKKGFIMGSDDDWNYIYTGKKGINKPGLGWVSSYIYDSFSIIVYSEIYENSPEIAVGVFKWIRGGWAGINMVNKRHIYNGIKRFAQCFKELIENPYLPEASELARTFSEHRRLPVNVLRKETEQYLNSLRAQCGENGSFFGNKVPDILTDGTYLAQMTKEEMESVMLVQYMKSLREKNMRVHLSSPDN